MPKEVKPKKGSKASEERKSSEAASQPVMQEDGTVTTPPLEEKHPLDEVLDPELKGVEYVEDANGVERVITIPEDELPPVFIEGEPFCIVNGKYVPYDEAQILFIDKKIEKLKKQKRYMQYKAEREKNVKEQAEREIAEKKKEMDKKRKEEEKRQKEEQKRIQKELNKY